MMSQSYLFFLCLEKNINFSVYCVWPTVLLVLCFFFVLRLWNKIISTFKNVVHCTEETGNDVSSQLVALRQENSLKRIFR